MKPRALNADLLYYMFDSANMGRWNDHLRPLDLSELDKQAHKAMISWVIAKSEEGSGHEVDWDALIEHTLFSFIKRIALTDLKPQVFHRIAREKRDEVNVYVLDFFNKNVRNTDPGFASRFNDYLYADRDSLEDRIINAAHYLATKWEFDMIYDVNRVVWGIEDTKAEIEAQVNQFLGVSGVSEIVDRDSDLYRFVNIVGQLRFQQRWVRTPRMPRTTVLGHSILVADMVFLNDLDRGVSGREVYWDYYSALFHDLPEVLTKDVITPVKTSVSGLPDLLGDIEKEMVEETIMPLLPSEWADELRIMCYDPFADSEDPPRFGRQIKACDVLGAWMEAYISTQYGITSRTLREGIVGAETRFRDEPDLEESIRAFEIIGGLRTKEI